MITHKWEFLGHIINHCKKISELEIDGSDLECYLPDNHSKITKRSQLKEINHQRLTSST